MRLMSRIFPPIMALILALAAFNSADVIRKWWESRGPAIEWQGVEVLTPVVQPGGRLEMIFTAVIHRQCPSDLRGFIVAEDGTVPIRLPLVFGGYTEPINEPVRIRVAITLPSRSDPGLSEIRSGRHVYRTLATRYCPSGTETDNSIPDVEFFLEVP